MYDDIIYLLVNRVFAGDLEQLVDRLLSALAVAESDLERKEDELSALYRQVADIRRAATYLGNLTPQEADGLSVSRAIEIVCEKAGYNLSPF